MLRHDLPPGLEVLPSPDAASLSVSCTERLVVILAGEIDTVAELEAAVAQRGTGTAGSAATGGREASWLVARLWEADGERSIDILRGAFALLVWDRTRGEVLAFRDHTGLHPLYWAEGEHGTLFFSPAIDLLLAQAGVGRAVNRAAIADHLSHRWPDKGETCFLSVKRVPPGNVLRVSEGARGLGRYWSPGLRGDDIDWLREEDLGRFDGLLEQAVKRSAGRRATGISLSGGLDSISVASILSALSASGDASRPLALSLGFPGDSNEEEIQRSVAAGLGLDQIFIPIQEATAPHGILRSSLELASSRALPLLSPWSSAYFNLARRASELEVASVLTGTGGDEWLTVSPYYAADMLLEADIGGILRMASANHRSFNVSWPRVLRGLGRFGVRPVASMAMGRLAPGPWRRNRLTRLLKKTPSWVAPDPALRRAMAERAERALTDPRPPGGFYVEELRASLDHPLVAWEVEESFETGRLAGVLYRHPYLDADLVEFLFRVPPRILNRGGRSKGLVREAVSRRFPGLGFERQKKVTGTSFYRSLLVREGPVEWKRLGGPARLAEIGAIDLNRTEQMAEKIFRRVSPEAHCLWDVLGLEVWLRARA